MPALFLQLLGYAQLIMNDQRSHPFNSRKGLALLAYLVCRAVPVPRSRLTDLLWPELSEQRGRRNLSRELSQLTLLLPACFVADYHTITWQPTSNLHVDVREVAMLLEPASENLDSDPAPLAKAVSLYQGELLSGLFLDDCAEFESWLVREREWWHQQIINALERLVVIATRQTDDAALRQYAYRWLELEPWQEQAHCAIMAVLARAGRRNEALAQYQICQRLLNSELGIEPSATTTALYEQIRRGAFDPPARLAALNGTAAVEREMIPTPLPVALPAYDWSSVPSVDRFYGRDVELATLRHHLIHERCRVVAVVGMGGIGKTTLAAYAANQAARHYDRIIWRSLLNAPSLPDLLRACLQQMQISPADIPASLDDLFTCLLNAIRQQRYLLILDNVESILQDSSHAGTYRPGYEVYKQLIRLIGAFDHRSCLLLTSREPPPPLTQLLAETPLVQKIRLRGLDVSASHELLRARGLRLPLANADLLIQRYSGNPLALALVAETIQDLYNADLDAFLHADTLIFDDIRAVLDQQWARLLPLEQDLLFWLAIARVPLTPEAVSALLTPHLPLRVVLEAIHSLQRRSLIEQTSAGFSVQNVVLEYLTELLITTVCAELLHQPPIHWRFLHSHALMQSQTIEYVRQSQVRLIVQPIIQQLNATTRDQLAPVLHKLLEELRATLPIRRGYAAGNIFNVLVQANLALQGANFAGLTVWQADARGTRLMHVNFARADLRGSLFSDTLRDAYAVAWSPDGALLAACVGSGEIRLWRVQDWQLVGRCVGHTGHIWEIAFSPDGSQLASCADDTNARIWDVASCQPLYTLRGHTQRVQSLAWNPSGTAIITGSRDQRARIWDVASQRVLHELRDHSDVVCWVAWNATGTLVATASHDQTVRLWDAQTGRAIRLLEHPRWLIVLAFSPDGTQIVTACGDQQIRLWDVQSGVLLQTLADIKQTIPHLAWSPDGQHIAGGGYGAVHIWEVPSGKLQTMLYGHTSLIVWMAWHPDGTRLASRGDTTIRIWDIRSSQATMVLQGTSDSMHHLVLSGDGTQIATSHVNELIRIWDRMRGEVRHVLVGHTGSVVGLSFSPDGTTLATAGFDQHIRIWDMQHGTLRALLRGSQRQIYALARSADGHLLASAGQDGTIWLWEWQPERVRHIFRGHGMVVTSVAFSPDDRILASGSADRTLRLWDVQTGSELKCIDGEVQIAYGLVFSHAGTQIATVNGGEILHIWNVSTGQLIQQFRSPTAMTGIDMSPDDTQIVTCGEQTVRIWDLASATNTLTIRHSRGLGPVFFTPDGTTLVTGSDDGHIRFWDAQTGALLRALPTPGPYHNMNITGATGITDIQRATLRELGAYEEP